MIAYLVLLWMMLCLRASGDLLSEQEFMLLPKQKARLDAMMSGKLNRKNVEIVLARYNEDYAWSDYYKKFRTVYNKGIDSRDPKSISLPNIGRESHTYLYHICKNYHKLADVTVFSHAAAPIGGYIKGSVNGHMFTNSTFHDFVLSKSGHFIFTQAIYLPNAAHIIRKGYSNASFPITRKQGLSKCPTPTFYTPDGHSGRTRLWRKMVAHIAGRCKREKAKHCSTHSFWDTYIRLPRPLDDIIYTAQGALFSATRTQIRSRPLDHYKEILAEIEKSNVEDSYVGYFMEFFWYYLVTSIPDPCLPDESTIRAPAFNFKTQKLREVVAKQPQADRKSSADRLSQQYQHPFAWSFNQLKNDVLDLRIRYEIQLNTSRTNELKRIKANAEATRLSLLANDTGNSTMKILLKHVPPSEQLLKRLQKRIGSNFTSIFNAIIGTHPIKDRKYSKSVYKVLGEKFSRAASSWVNAQMAVGGLHTAGGVGQLPALGNNALQTESEKVSVKNEFNIFMRKGGIYASAKAHIAQHQQEGLAYSKKNPRKPLLCATFLSCNSFALEFLTNNIRISQEWCDWVVVFYKGGTDEIAAWNRTRLATLPTVVHVAAHEDSELNNSTAGYIPKPVLYSYVLPLVEGYDKVWMLDGDMDFTGFDYPVYAAMAECAQDSPDSVPVLISQPIIKESSQYYTPVNQNFWNAGGGFLLDTAVTYWQYIEIQAPLFDARFFSWFFKYAIDPFMNVYRAMHTDWGMDQSWCYAARDYALGTGQLKGSTAGMRRGHASLGKLAQSALEQQARANGYEIPKNLSLPAHVPGYPPEPIVPAPCAILLVPLSHKKSSAMRVAALHAKLEWKRYTHFGAGSLTAALHEIAFPHWFAANYTLNFMADRAGFLREKWPRLTWREVRQCILRKVPNATSIGGIVNIPANNTAIGEDEEETPYGEASLD